MHSWLDEKETQNRVKNYRFKCDVKIYYRDIENMEDLETARKIGRAKEIKLPNMSSYKQIENIYLNIRN